MKLTETQRKVLDIVKDRSGERPVSLSELSELTHLDKRVVKQVIHSLRKEYPICSNVEWPSGYYMGTAFDVVRTSDRLNHTADTIAKTANSLVRVCDKHRPRVRISIPEEYLDHDKLCDLVGPNDAKAIEELQGTVVSLVPVHSFYGDITYLCVFSANDIILVPQNFLEWAGYENEF